MPETFRPLTPDTLMARIERIPRVPLAHLPTPFDSAPRLTAALGGPRIYIKRDDMTGLAFGGNKTRQLEYLFAELQARGADCIVAGAYTQSNWCRQITAAACKQGLQVSLVLLHGEKGPALQGNLLLDHLMGAEVTVVDLDNMERLPPLLEERATALREAGRRPYIVDPFDIATLSLSAIGYVRAFVELDRQLAEAGIGADAIYVAGANMTPAGLMVGARALGRATRVVGIAPIEWQEDRAVDIARIANATAARLDLDPRFAPADVTCETGYIGERYGVVTPEGRAALRLVAETEGVLLDPVYSSKAMAGLIDHIKTGRVGRDETVVFLHTGGTPAIFAYADDLLKA